MKNLSPKHILSQKGFEKLISGHPWIHSKDMKHLNDLPTQTGILHFGEHWFFHSPMSKLRLRRLGPTTRNWLLPQEVSFISQPSDFENIFYSELLKLFKSRLEFKKKLLISAGEDLCLRWIFSESDLIPGLIIDVFKNQVVCQILTAPIELFWPILEKIIATSFKDVTGVDANIIVDKSATVRLKEGLQLFETEQSEGNWYSWNGLVSWMTPGGSQKTGAYFDQKANHISTLEWAQKLECKSAWDLCCYEGGFGLHLAKSGLDVISVDQSEGALATATKNATRNEISSEIFKTENSDVFDYLRTQFDKSKKVDLIVLDPPSFVKSRDELHSAMKGYKELNLRAMHSLNSKGLLVSCSCSQSVSRELYLEMLQSAAHDTRKSIRILDVKGPSLDHSPLVGFDESNYLQAWYLLVE